METTRKYRRFRRAFKVAAVQRMQQGESPSALARELGIRRKLLYEWKQRIEQLADSGASRSRFRDEADQDSGLMPITIPG